MTYESVKKPTSTFVPVQKKASVSLSPGGRSEREGSAIPPGEQQLLGKTPATDADWLMKSPLFKGKHRLQRSVVEAEESQGEQDIEAGVGVDGRQKSSSRPELT